MEANLNSRIQILGRAATVGKRYFGLYKDLVLIMGKVRELERIQGEFFVFVIAIVVKLEKNSIFLKKGKTVISVENRKFSRSRMKKRTASLNPSREI